MDFSRNIHPLWVEIREDPTKKIVIVGDSVQAGHFCDKKLVFASRLFARFSESRPQNLS